MVDSSDQERMGEARKELHNLLSSPELTSVPVVVVANKQDLPAASSVSQLAEQLGLRELPTTQPWYVQGACARTGEGVVESLHQLSEMLKKQRRAH